MPLSYCAVHHALLTCAWRTAIDHDIGLASSGLLPAVTAHSPAITDGPGPAWRFPVGADMAVKFNCELMDLRSFLTVHEVRSFNPAAAILNIFQPALSRRIQRLEALVGGRFSTGPVGD